MEMKQKPIIWTISGADCSGGAGIAADIKTGHSLGVEVCHLITANTVQNAQQLLSVNPVDVDILQQQYQALFADKKPSVIKIGLLATTEQVSWLISVIREIKADNKSIKIVFDPVGSASVGGKFADFELEALTDLWPFIDVVTPNLPEAQAITGLSTSDQTRLSKALIDKGVATSVVKGGHKESAELEGKNIVDVAYEQSEEKYYQVSAEKVNTHYSHGGGCSFATALSSFLAYGYLVRDALTLTKAFIQQGLNQQKSKTQYYGAFEQTQWPSEKVYFPKVIAPINQQYAQLPAFADIESVRGKQGLGLYPVVDSIEWLEKLLPLGLEIIQLRVKNKAENELESIIKQAVALSKQFRTRLFINDYWPLAIKHGAYGVHIGQEDLLDADLEAIQQAGLRLGISTHGCYEFLLAQQLRPSYLAVGAIFPTKTKDMTGQIQGIDNLKQMLNLTDTIPVVAIGGINLERASGVWQTGVDSIAVVTAITESKNYQQAVEEFKALIKNSA